MGTQNGVGVGSNTQMRHGFEGRMAKALAGVEKYVPAATSMVLNGKTTTQPEVVKWFQDTLELFKDLREARRVAKEQLKRVRGELVAAHSMYVAVQRAMQANFGIGSPTLEQFGYSLGLRKPRTGAASVQAQAKAQLTRALRHTMGPRQRAALQAGAPSLVTVHLDGTVRPGAARPGDPPEVGSTPSTMK